MVCERFVGSGRLQEGGYLGTHKQDFEAHRKGCDWRHEADHIDMNPIIPAFPGVNVQETLELIAAGTAGGQDLEGVLSLGNNAGSYTIDMNGNYIHEVRNPTLPQDAATKWYVDQQLSAEDLNETLTIGNTTDGIDIDINSGSKIINSTLGGALEVLLGANPGATGGTFRVDAGSGSTGGNVNLYAGAGTVQGGDARLVGGDASSTIGGVGGDVYITGGPGYGGTSGSIILNAGEAIVWPSADGTAGQVIITDGAGNLSFGDGGGIEDLEQTLLIGNDGGDLEMTNLSNIYMNTGTSLAIGTLSPTANAIHISGGTNPSVVLEEVSGAATVIEDVNSGSMNITKTSPTQSLINISPIAEDGTSDALVRVGRNTNSSGDTGLIVLYGDDTTGVNHRLYGKSSATLAERYGGLILGGSSNTSASVTFSNTGTSLRPNYTQNNVGTTSTSVEVPGVYYSHTQGFEQVFRTLNHGYGTIVPAYNQDYIVPLITSIKFVISYVSSQPFTVTLPTSIGSVDTKGSSTYPYPILRADIKAVHNAAGSVYNASYDGCATWIWDGSVYNVRLNSNHEDSFFGTVANTAGLTTPTLVFTPNGVGGHSIRWLIDIELTALFGAGP